MERNRSDVERVQRRLGGAALPRADVTDALTRTFFAEWAAVGYAALSLERVASRAGVGKAALYRRWGSKPEMAGDLLSRVAPDMTVSGDTGSLEGDLEALLLAIRRVLRHPLIRRILADLHAGIGREPVLAAAIRPMQQARRARAKALIDRAVARGELALDVDRETVADLIGAPLYWRLVVVNGRADRAYVKRLAAMTAAAAKVGSLTGGSAR